MPSPSPNLPSKAVEAATRELIECFPIHPFNRSVAAEASLFAALRTVPVLGLDQDELKTIVSSACGFGAKQGTAQDTAVKKLKAALSVLREDS